MQKKAIREIGFNGTVKNGIVAVFIASGHWVNPNCITTHYCIMTIYPPCIITSGHMRRVRPMTPHPVYHPPYYITTHYCIMTITPPVS